MIEIQSALEKQSTIHLAHVHSKEYVRLTFTADNVRLHARSMIISRIMQCDHKSCNVMMNYNVTIYILKSDLKYMKYYIPLGCIVSLGSSAKSIRAVVFLRKRVIYWKRRKYTNVLIIMIFFCRRRPIQVLVYGLNSSLRVEWIGDQAILDLVFNIPYEPDQHRKITCIILKCSQAVNNLNKTKI